jgi:hypothetical protein
MPTDLGTLLDRITAGSSRAAILGTTVLAGQVHFLYSTDPEWTKAHLLPLLDWSVHPERAPQAWDGFLVSGQPNEAILRELLPLYERAAPHVTTFPDRMRNRYAEHLASIAVFGSSDPMRDGWLGRILPVIEPSDREHWAGHVGHYLTFLKGDQGAGIWNRWLREYWLNRVQGRPLPLNEGEVHSMLGWIVPLAPVFPEVIDIICDSPPARIQEPFVLVGLVEKQLANRFPAAMTKLLHRLLSNAKEPFWACSEAQKLVGELATAGATSELLLPVRNELARLGCS